MASKRIHEIAAEHELTIKELMAKLGAAGVPVKTASSAIEESVALGVLGPSAKATAERRKAEAAKAAASSAAKARTPREPSPSTRSGVSGRRRVVIDAGASRRPQASGPSGTPGGGKRGKRQRQKRREYEEAAEATTRRKPTSANAITVNSGATVKEVAESLNVPVPDVIKQLMQLGEMATVTQTLTDEAIGLVAEELGLVVELVHSEDEIIDEAINDRPEDLKTRPPVVTIMGHVDHGKTSLLDAIRETEVVAGEAGGITQHIGAYQVRHNDKTVTFLDTPGHEAFTAMRARGAKVTDVAVIVVAADDGVKPQTEEAIDHARAAKVPIMVAVNKIDKEGSQPEKVRTQLAGLGLQPEEWGGQTIFADVSAKSREGLDNLLEMLLLMAEVEDLKANPSAAASGTTIESKLDPGRGPVITMLVQRGTLQIGDALVAGSHWGRVRAMQDFRGQRIQVADPGMPVEILGFDTVPQAGEHIRVAENDRRARQLAAERGLRLKSEALARAASHRISLEDIFEQAQEGGIKDLNLVLKADVSGSLEAVEDEIARLPQNEVAVKVIHKSVGGINASDVMLAAASNAVVLGFNVRPIQDAALLATREGVEIRSYSVIYKAIDDLRAAMEGMLEPEEVEETTGYADVRDTFRASKIGLIAGCYVTEGELVRGAKVRLIRDGTIVYDGEIASLRRFKEDVREVKTGFECGVVLKDYMDVKPGDELELYTTTQVERELAK